MQKTYFFIGFMGSGKSYWGERMAGQLQIPFIDLDNRIRTGENASIAEIFDRYGDAGFREYERRYLHELATQPPVLVATGGGTPCFFDNMDWMNRHGITIYFDVPVDLLAARLRLDNTIRPVLQGVAEPDLSAHIAALLRQREPFYRQARIILEYTGNDADFQQRLEAQLGG